MGPAGEKNCARGEALRFASADKKKLQKESLFRPGSNRRPRDFFMYALCNSRTL